MRTQGSYICIVNEEKEYIRQFCERVFNYMKENKIKNAICIYNNAEIIVHDHYSVDLIFHKLWLKNWEVNGEN